MHKPIPIVRIVRAVTPTGADSVAAVVDCDDTTDRAARVARAARLADHAWVELVEMATTPRVTGILQGINRFGHASITVVLDRGEPLAHVQAVEHALDRATSRLLSELRGGAS